jgi:RecA-family ATPase
MPPPSWLIDGQLPEGGTTIMYGKPGSGKSFLALDYGICVALGVPWHGLAAKAGRVLYVAAEGAAGLSVRVRAWMAAFGAADIPGLDIYPRRVNLLDPEQRAALAAYTAERGYALLVLDTLARSMVGGDENSARDVGLAIDAVDHCRQERPGLTALVVHHMDKGGSTYRGSSALEGAADAMLEVSDSDGTMTIVCDKEKDHAKAAPIRLAREVVDLGGGADSCVLRAVGAAHARSQAERDQEALRAVLAEDFARTGASRKLLVEALGMSETKVSRAANALLKLGVIVNAGTPNRPHFKIAE